MGAEGEAQAGAHVHEAELLPIGGRMTVAWTTKVEELGLAIVPPIHHTQVRKALQTG